MLSSLGIVITNVWAACLLLLAAPGGLRVSVNIAPPYGSSDRSQGLPLIPCLPCACARVLKVRDLAAGTGREGHIELLNCEARSGAAMPCLWAAMRKGGNRLVNERDIQYSPR